jgi:hypothetical protein
VERRALLGVLGFAAAAGLVAGTGPGRRWGLGRLAGPAVGEAPPRPHRDRDSASSRGGPTVDDADATRDRVSATAGPDASDEPAPAPAVTLGILCRESLGLEPARPGGRAHRIERLTLHHSAVRLESAARAPARLRGHQAFHRAQGWPDIAYHYGVDLAGNVYELRDPGIASDTFTDYEPAGHLSIVCEGHFGEQAAPDAMLDALAILLAHLSDRFEVPTDTLGGHRDHASTACPGDALHSVLPELRQRAGEVLRSDAPNAEVVCGSVGDARIAAIEAR